MNAHGYSYRGIPKRVECLFPRVSGLFGDFYCLEPGKILFCAQAKI